MTLSGMFTDRMGQMEASENGDADTRQRSR